MPRIWPRRDDTMACTFAVYSVGTVKVTAWIGSSSTGAHLLRPSLIASPPQVRKAWSEESTEWY